MLMAAGDDRELTENDFLVCRWPEETALAVAETFYVARAPLAHLRFEHVRSKWAAIAAYGRVQNALLIALADLVDAARYDRVMRYNRQRYGGDTKFEDTLELARADLEEMRSRGLEDPVTAYVTGLYIRSILAESHLSTYFSEEAAEAATGPVASVIANAMRQLVGVV